MTMIDDNILLSYCYYFITYIHISYIYIIIYIHYDKKKYVTICSQTTYSLYITIHDSSGSAPAEAAIHCVLGEVFVAHQFRTAKHLCSQTRRNGSGRMLRRREFPEILDSVFHTH